MRNKVKTILASVTAALALATFGGLVGARTVGSRESSVVVPSLVSYQGQVTTNGSPYDGVGYFKFAVVNSAGNTTFWSNDGTSAAGAEPTSCVQLDVENGLFSVMLADTSLGMTSLTASVFSGSDRHLRVWFGSDGATFERLQPDQQLGSVPYALQAQNADTLDGHEAADFALQGQNGEDSLPSGAMILSSTRDDPSLLASGFRHTDRVVGDVWRPRADMLTSRRELAVAVTADGTVYAIGGHATSGYLTTNEAYDPTTDSWTSKAPMPTARSALGAATVDGVIYAIGGEAWQDQRVVFSNNEAYDTATDSWTTKASMPTARRGMAVVAVEGIVYAIGGWGGTSGDGDGSSLTTVEAYDPQTDSWTERSPRPTAGSVSGTVVDGTIYTFGPGSVVAAYDPCTDSWSTRAPIPTKRWGFDVAVLDGIIYVVGGGEHSAYLTEAYNPQTDSWETWDLMQAPRIWFAAASTHRVIYVFGGYSEQATVFFSTVFYTPPMYVYRKE